MLNIDKSFFHKGEYVGYRNGVVYRIRKQGKCWVANQHAGDAYAMANEPMHFWATTLRELSKKLEA